MIIMLTMKEFEAVKEALAAGKTTISNGTEAMLSQLNAGISKEYRVAKAFDENDSFVETWRFLDGKGYTGRNTYSSTWYDYICGVEDGYFEPNAPAHEDVVYILCDQNGNELMVAGNGCGCDFPTTSAALEKFFEEEFAPCQSYVDWKAWLLQFRDPANEDVKRWLESAPYYCYEENFLHRNELVSRTVLKKYRFFGEMYYFFEDSYKSKVCGVSWKEYSVSKKLHPENFEVSVLGYSFDPSKHGDGISQREVETMLMKLLNEVFDGKLGFSVRPRSNYSSKNMVEVCDGWAVALPDYDVLSRIKSKLNGVNGAFNRTSVQEALPELKSYIKENYFLNSKEGIASLKRKYPNIQLGHPLNIYYR